MVSPDQAEQVADSLLQPARQEFTAKQEKVARRKAIKTNLFVALVPSAVAAGVALASIDYFGHPSASFFFAVTIGGIVGSMLRKAA